MNHIEVAVFGGGCFWCTEAVFSRLKGVGSVVPGYAGGKTDNPTYYDVVEGDTGHAEAVKIEFDPNIISFEDLLAVFFGTHDPTTKNRQGNDVGEQYRSVIFYTTDAQKKKAEQIIKETDDAHVYENPVVTEVVPLGKFYEAEEYHKNYYENNKTAPYCSIVIEPKLEKLAKRFKALMNK
ncbi:MAG: peptide-methionine (S)-S-oxide reductase [Candidatus Zambryskibacteria bacterium CG10_big_fil_rev_8_21_14_0_10_42_12]|uniref:Peptide methionine sulfoxide reductase MsrA n=1 Tax=Candidatus Zambryskibacteria bacterium CG10_big_fil_rev_8_21_14_0_10_42_12 TaxID=1975115 RepID=A0A2H0QWK3_9BACT|nr:MAG: peptide-methionine (S)-S-oxide reductase [Candidatus Zambryskibacteria bacterium CG10_big_fil_rev_8_21_14_0_10_42_12]